MEASDLKCDLPDSSTGQKSSDLKTAHVNTKLVVKAGKGVKRKSPSPLESSKRRRRNNPASNRLGPERTDRRKNKANLSPPKHHAHSHGLQTIDSGVDSMKNRNYGFLSDDMVVPKKSLDICRQNTADNGDSLNILKGECDDHRSNSNREIDANEQLPTNVASPYQYSSDYKEKSGLLINIALPSQLTNSKAMKDTIIGKNVSSNNEVSPSKISRKTKKKLTNSKDGMQGASLSPFQVSNDKKNKKDKSPSRLNKSCNNIMSHSQASNGTRNRKSNNADVKNRKENNTPLERKDNTENSTSAFDGKNEYVNGNNSEEDLEENAAWMLSSRFDTTFAGFSGNSSSSMSQSANGIQGNFEHKNESTSVDDLGRMLRPRNPYGQSLVRKRRHFYEVSYKDMDPYSILKQRIRVYWPLDQIWYFGLVKDYDPETKLHHVKYDDRDEEWINLQHERFKLLLYPSEVSGKVRSRKSRAGLNKKSREGDIKEASGAILEDSVPIIAWLAEPKLRKKLTSANKKTSLGEPGEAHMVTDNASVSDRELSYVYSRKKFRKRRQGYDKELDEDFVHGNLSSSINILASVADSALVLEELNVFGSLMEFKQVTFKINFHFHCIDYSTFGMEGPCFRILYLLEYGTLVNILPMVHVDIVIVDNAMGLRLFLFYGSLKWVIELLCSMIRVFDGKGKFRKSQVPCSSIGVNLSGKFLFLLYRFLKMERSKLRYLENKLRNQCVTIRAIPVEECTLSTIKKLQEDSSQMLCSSMFKDVLTSECFPEKELNLDMDPKTCPTDAIHAEPDNFATMSLHINSLIQSNAPPDDAQKNELCHEGSADLHEKSSTEDPSDPVSDITMENVAASLGQTDAIPSVNHLKVDTDALSVNNDCNWMPCIHNVNNTSNSTENQDVELNKSDETVQDAEKPNSLYPGGYSSPDKNKFQSVHVEERSIHSPNPTAPRSIRRNIQGTISPKNGHRLKSWNNDFMGYGFVSGNKKPRTQVSYSLPFGGFDLGAKRRSHQRKAKPYKKFDSFSAHNLLDPLTCNANVLVTSMDRGWRVYGAQIVLESDDQKDWKICVKFSGVTKYTYKAQHLLQPGITNRYTHAMMWKGGKDWTLEFTDRNQWFVFKEIHEECHNRNLQASYVKNIPIPGVRLIENDCDDFYGVPFVRNSYEYHRIVGTEVDMALDPAYVLYDMDTDDEKWVSEMRSSTYMMEKGFSKITNEVFEKVIDNFEKFAYAQQCEEFSEDEIEEFMDDIGSPEIVKTIYEYWRKKRMKKGMPLIRQFQPALWEVYQKQLKEWESSVSRMQNLNNGCAIKKPQMFAFCLRPRGLEAPNKSLKQKSQRKFVSKGCHRAFAREPSMSYTSGRRTNGHVERISISSYESSDSYHSNDDSDRSQCLELHRANSKKKPRYVSPRDPNSIMPLSQNKKPKKNNIYEAPHNTTHIQRDSLRRQRTDTYEFKLRDALNLANHASTIANTKREKARFMMHKANLAIHKATAALMMAEAMKDSEKHLFNEYEGDDDDDDSDEVESEDDETEEDIDSDEDEDMDEDI